MPAVLLADDNEYVREITAEFLRRGGYDVVEAADGQKALDRFTPDLYALILDEEMPGMRGWDVIQRVRRQGYTGLCVLNTSHADDRAYFQHRYGADTATIARSCILVPKSADKIVQELDAHRTRTG